jgi:DNA-binding CsgD family transcriptional regulator
MDRAPLSRHPQRLRSHTRQHLHIIGSDHPAARTRHEPLIERAVEVNVLRSAVGRLAHGDGGIVALEAAAGLGKTALLEYAATEAARAGCTVRRAAPGPLERHFPFGVVRALFEAPLRDASADQRAALLDGAAAGAGALLLDGAAPAADGTAMLAHSVLWLCSAMAERAPLALIIDDAHWADRSSLVVLAYLARRIADVPLLIVVGARADDPDAESDLLSLLGGVRGATVLHPQPLSPLGTAQLVHRLAPGAPDELCVTCHRAGGGNPWLVGELGRQIAVHGASAVADDDATRVTAIARNVVRQRVAALSRRDRGVAEALAVIGADAPPAVVAAVGGVGVGELRPARDALVAAGLLDAFGERFAHNLIAVAIAEDLSRSEHERLHRESALALIEIGARADVVASHLLRCGPQGDPEISALLSRAAADAADHGAPHTAVAYLERALAERAPGDDRGRMLCRLAVLTFDAGLPDARQRLREALAEAQDSDCRLDVLTRLAGLNAIDLGDPRLVELLERELAAERDPSARVAVEIASLDSLMMMPGRSDERARRAAAIDPASVADPALRRALLAHHAELATERGMPDAQECAALAREALAGDELLSEAWRRAAYHLAQRVLLLTDHVDEARAALTRLREQAIARGSLWLRGAAEWFDAELQLRTGHVAAAENRARLVFDLSEGGVGTLTGGAVHVLVAALAERGAFEEAHDVLREHRLDGELGRMSWDVNIRHSRARLALAEGDYEQALADAMAAGELREEQGRRNPTWTPWRSTAARALAHLGRREEAVVLADAELRVSERFGAPVPIVAALHARAVAEADDEVRVALCERALAVAEGTPALLEAVRVRIELGSTLSRLGRRIEARDALRPALADADAVGALLLAQRARRELVATGLRPRQAALEGAAALTPRQRQICELAAGGKGNRAIAQELFLSIKTVETHLAAGFRKLGVSGRDELAAELALG